MKVLLCFFLLIVTNVYSQSDPLSPTNHTRLGEILPPSPNASSITKHGGVPVNYSSGRPNINIPIHQVSTKNLSLPISVSYSTSGFNVNEIASRVGLSWVLNTGGVITRTVYDGPDEISQHPAIPSGFGTDDNQTIYDFLKTVQQGGNDIVDMQHDIFSFNFGEYQGKFIIHNNAVVFLQNTNLIIRTSLLETNFIDGCHFKITAPDGTIYYFGGSASETTGSEAFGLNCGGDKDFAMTETAWYLKKIVHPDGDFIELFYSPVTFSYLSSVHQSETRSIRYTEVDCPGGSPSSPNNNTNSTCVTEIVSHGVRLDRIQASTGSEVKVNYRNRPDLVGDFLVDDIVINKWNSIQPLKSFKFQYDEVTANSFLNTWNQNEQQLQRRMFLSSITEKDEAGNTGVGSYLFGYNSTNGLPARLSFAQDYWGFFNGKNNGTLVYFSEEAQAVNNLSNLYVLFNAGADRTPDANYSKKGLLNKITYPTGGFDEIEYEGHKYRVTEPIVSNPQNITVSVSDFNTSDVTPKIVESSVFTPNQSQSAQFYVAANYFGQNSYDPPADRVEYSVFNITDGYYIVNEATLEAGNNNPNEHNQNIYLTAGKSYKIKLKIYGDDVYGGSTITYTSYNVQMVTSDKEGGGTRVAKVTTRSFDSENQAPKKYFYSPLQNLSISSCDEVGYQFNNFTKSKIAVLCENTLVSAEVHNYTLSASTYNNIGVFSGSPFYYSSVIESNGNDFENGGTEYLYGIETDLAPVRKYGVSPLGSPYTNMEHLNALLTSKKSFSRIGGNYISKGEEITAYKVDSRVAIDYDNYTIRQGYLVNAYLPGMVTSVSNQGIGLFDVYQYKTKKSWVYTDTKTTKSYSLEGVLNVSNTIKFEHSSTFNIKPSIISTYGSSNEKLTLKTTYTKDLFQQNQPVWLNNLEAKGCLETPIEEIKLKHINGVDYVVSGQLVIYHPTLLKPVSVYQLEVLEPIALSNFNACTVNNGVFVFDARYKIDVEYAYSGTGDMVQQTSNGIEKSYLWGYNKTYPVAEVVGANYAAISALVNQSLLDNPPSEAALRAELNNLRSGLAGTKALVTSYTYKPLVGVASETDPNGRISFYEYDVFGRLSIVRDHDNNIVKKICYNYTGQPENCSASCVNETPNWQNTSKPPVCQQSAGVNTGYQLQEQRDMNPCSPTYNQTQDVTVYNPSACPPPSNCNSGNCNSDAQKCVNGVCETGVLKIISTRRVKVAGVPDENGNIPISWQYYCTSVYCFSDGTTSAPFEYQTSGFCSTTSCN